ncbi:MAG TPA: glycosyltransferase [Caulobacteraceae bacterium]
MKVLLVSGSAPPLACGVGDYTLRLAQALAAVPGVRPAVLTSHGAALDDAGEVEVFPVMKGWDLSEAKTLTRLVGQWSPDLLHVQYPTQGYGRGLLPTLTPWLGWRLGLPVVRTWHEIPGPTAWRFALEALAPGPFVVVRPGFVAEMPLFLRPLVTRRAGGYIASAPSIGRSRASDDSREALRRRLANGRRRLVVFFGFLYPFKGVEQLFDIADPASDQIVIAGEASVDDAYLGSIRRRANEPPWRGSVTMLGSLSNAAAADLLAAADAVVLPFRHGGGVWNSSMQAAILQGVPVITTSASERGLDERRNVYFAAPDHIADMKAGLDRLAGRRRPFDAEIDGDAWPRIAQAHAELYAAACRAHRRGRPAA